MTFALTDLRQSRQAGCAEAEPRHQKETHLSTALAYHACLKGHSVLFAIAVDIVNTLAAAHSSGRLKLEMKKHLKPTLLCIDELGYLPLDKTGADLLFQMISHRYERGSILPTTNRAFKHWIHVYSAGEITLKLLHPKRGREVIEAFGVIPRYGGVIIHDCWASYLAYEQCGHGLCGSHLLRGLTFIVDSNGYAWAENMKRLLKETCAKVMGRESKMLTPGEYKNLQKRYRNILTQGEKQLPPIPPKHNGKRGKVAKSDAHNLWERLKKHEQAVLLFAKRPEVAFTNNRAERNLRMSKVKQKISGCFRTRKVSGKY